MDGVSTDKEGRDNGSVEIQDGQPLALVQHQICENDPNNEEKSDNVITQSDFFPLCSVEIENGRIRDLVVSNFPTWSIRDNYQTSNSSDHSLIIVV